MYDLNNFCNIITLLRREKGWSQAKFADIIGISPQSVSKWECGIGFPDVTLFPVIAEVLSVPIGVLFGEKNETEENMTMKSNQIAAEYLAEFDVCKEIKVSLGNICRVEIIDGEREKALVRAVGDPAFMRYFSVERESDTLFVDIKNPTGSAFFWKPYNREGYAGENFVQIFSGLADSNAKVVNYLDLCAATQDNTSGNYEVTVTTVSDELSKTLSEIKRG